MLGAIAMAPSAAANSAIRVTNDADLASFPGAGTPTNPYVIDGRSISASGGTGIDISGTTKHLALRNVSVSSGGGSNDALRLTNVRNVTVENSTLESSRNCLHVKDSRDVVLMNVTAKTCKVGFFLEGTTSATIRDNKLSVNDKDIRFARSPNNTLENNNLSTATGQFGLFFDDTESYANAINTSNVVNAIPIHWYSGISGTPIAPRSISLPKVELQGATNVAQIMLHNVSYVTLDGASAKSGSAAGIVIRDSRFVNVTTPAIEGNAAQGILVERGDNVSIQGGTIRMNAKGGASFVTTRDGSLQNANVSYNADRGVLIDQSVGIRMTNVGLFSNGAEDVTIQTNSNATLVGNTLIGPSTMGVHVTSSNAVMDRNTFAGHAQAVRFSSATGSNVTNSAITILSGQTGFHFDAENAYNNSIDPTNLVNGQAVRWYTGHQNVVLPNLLVDVKGITNVAQIMLHQTTNVTLESPTAKNGVAAGILLYQSNRANVTTGSSAANAADGVLVSGGSNNSLLQNTLSDNTNHGVRVLSSPSVIIENNAVEKNRGRGISVEQSELALLRGNAILANVRSAIFFDKSGPGAAVVENNLIQSNSAGGLFADASTLGSIAGNNITDNADTGIQLSSSAKGARLENNSISNHTNNIRLVRTEGAELRSNVITIRPGQFGVFFDDETSYNNTIPPDNRVNGVSIRWLVREAKTTLGSARVELAGITNVAQAMVYKSSHVNLTALTLANGTARGLYVYQSDNVTLNLSVVGPNVKEGIQSINANELRIENSTITQSGARGVFLENSRVVLANDTIRTSGAEGVAFVRSTGRVEDTLVQQNRGGALLDSSSLSHFSRNNVSDNGDYGLFVSSSTLAYADRDAFANQTKAIQLTKSTSGNYTNVSISKTASQYGVHFSDETSYDNEFNTSVTINGEALQWHTRCSGTIPNATAQTKGATNVAQIMLYLCANVTLDSPAVANATAVGIYVYQSQSPTVANATVVGSTGSGIKVTLSPSALVTNASVRDGLGTGIELAGGSSPRVELASIVNNTGDGLSVVDAQSPVVKNLTSQKNGGVGARFLRGANALIENSTFELGKQRGLVVDGATGKTTLQFSTASGNTLEGFALVAASDVRAYNNSASSNGVAGFLLERLGPGAILDANRASANQRGVRLVSTEYASINNTRVTALDGQTGFHFDDETSFNNVIPQENVVNGVPVRWFTGLTGTESNPRVLDNVTVELRGITNVAQVMIYKSAYVKLVAPTATGGTNRGIYLYGSSAITVLDANVSNNKIGVQLHQTQSSTLRNATATGATQQAVLVTSSLANAISQIDASGAPLALSLDSASRDNRVQQIGEGVVDPSVKNERGNNLIADAGAVKRARVGFPVSFSDSLASSRFDGERIVSHSWSFGDGQVGSGSRPTHTYPNAGSFVANYSFTTADGQTLWDTVRVVVVPPLSAPQNVVVTVGNKNATLVWSPPLHDGGVAVTGYKVYREGTLRATIGNATTFLDEGLTNGVSYSWLVSAVTVDGEGPQSALATAVPATTPSAPRDVKAVVGAKSASLNWTPPADAGGLPITAYRIVRDGVVVGEVGNVTTFADSALTNGRSYSYAIEAWNAMGAGARSANATAIPKGVPDAPRNVVLLPGNAAVTLLWDAPEDSGGSPISGYKVYRALSGAELVLVATVGNVTEYRDAGLANDRPYAFAISATNALGEGNRTAQVSATPRAVDALKPLVLMQAPANGALLADARPVVSARFVDNVGVTQARLWIDGAEVTPSVTDSSVEYVFPNDLSPGNHSARLVVRDAAGNEAASAWAFRVLASAERVPFLVYSNLTVTPDPAIAGSVVVVRVHVENVGLAKANRSLSLLENGTELATARLDLQNGSATDVAFVFFAAGLGMHNVSVEDAFATFRVNPPPEAGPVVSNDIKEEGPESLATKKLSPNVLPFPTLGVLGAVILAAMVRRLSGRP